MKYINSIQYVRDFMEWTDPEAFPDDMLEAAMSYAEDAIKYAQRGEDIFEAVDEKIKQGAALLTGSYALQFMANQCGIQVVDKPLGSIRSRDRLTIVVLQDKSNLLELQAIQILGELLVDRDLVQRIGFDCTKCKTNIDAIPSKEGELLCRICETRWRPKDWEEIPCDTSPTES